MMPKSRTEEQFPLLLFLVDNQEVTQNNKRIFSRGRLGTITSGATAIITEWPNYLSSCWATAFISGVTLFIITIMLTSYMSLESHHRIPRCIPNHELDNKTIHLVHSWHDWSSKQVKLLENITNSFPHYKIHLVLIDNKLLTSPETTTEHKATTKPKSKMIRALTPHKITIEQLLKKHPNIFVSHMTYNSIFKDTPLFMKWMELSEQLRIFAVRIIQMWQFGGLSFDLMEYKIPTPKKFSNITDYTERRLKKLIRYGRDTYETLESELVSIDHYGLHMECKTPCHAFFGKILMKLRRAQERSTPRSVLNGPMFTFCSAGVIDKLFCHEHYFI